MGCKLSSASRVVPFRHNDMNDLEDKLIRTLIDGKFDTILIIVEGIYSMEGSIVNLPEVIRLKNKYKAYLYVDEAHSIGALGNNGRGVTDYFNIDPSNVDILMGTFTKSFGASGGYVAGKKHIIDHIRSSSHSYTYATPMAPAIMEQISGALSIISGAHDGQDSVGRIKLDKLSENTKYFRTKLAKLGFQIVGNIDSPVVPLLCYSPIKTYKFSKALKMNGIGAQGVGYPATELTKCRIRFCLSSGHTAEMIDEAIDAINSHADKWGIYRRYQKFNQ